MTTPDYTEIHTLYGFLDPITLELDLVDVDWLESNFDAVAYSRTRAALPVGFWLSEGFLFEVADVRYVGPDDERATGTVGDTLVYLRRPRQAA